MIPAAYIWVGVPQHHVRQHANTAGGAEWLRAGECPRARRRHVSPDLRRGVASREGARALLRPVWLVGRGQAS